MAFAAAAAAPVLRWLKKGKAAVSWEAAAVGGGGALRRTTRVVAEADGYLEVEIELAAIGGAAVALSRAALSVPFDGAGAGSRGPQRHSALPP